MAGWPIRPSRASFGPTYENERAVKDPKKDIGAPIFNLDFWQLAGMGLVVPRAAIVFTVDAVPAVSAVPYQGLAWDPDSDIPVLAVARTGVGVYDIPFVASYPDENGQAQALALIAGGGFNMSPTPNIVKVHFPAPPAAQVLVFDMAGAPADPPPTTNTLVLFW